jgi:hypothetical protein
VTDEAALLRLMKTGFQRYTADPATRQAAARTMLSAALNLYASQTSAGEAALHAADVITVLGNDERRQKRAG